MQITEKDVRQKLEQVLDPELHISIVDLGLIYGIKIDGKKVKITMTLTTIGCPLSVTIEQDIKNTIQQLGVEDTDISIELTFDPPWSMDKMSENAKALLGIP